MTAVAALMLQRPALAGPVGGSVVEGAAAIAQSGTTTNINQSSNKAIINWQSFSVGATDTVNFHQPSAAAATLNRVIGNETSIISGAINANGQVFIVNSAGVLFSKGSQVNVGGLVASTLDISNANFMAGNYTFSGNSSASVVNQGRIKAGSGGYVALLGKTVSNEGVIVARLGTVAMASGEQITLNFGGDSLVDVTIDKGTLNALVANKRAIIANGGTVILTAKAADEVLSAQVNNSGIIQARSMAALTGGSTATVKIGKIKLLADGGSVTSSGKLDVSARKGGNAGKVTAAATGGNVTLSGKIDATAANGTGGTIIATGTAVTLTQTAALDASGLIGGTILVGGDRHGGSDSTEKFVAETVANATSTTIAAGATLTANGSAGDGGNIAVWSDVQTNYDGAISATAAGTGNGGFAEVSGKAVLNFNGTVDLSSAYGATGTLLLDPYNITISTGANSGSNGGSGVNDYTATSTSVINATTLINALANANVVITTGGAGSAGSDLGNITVSAALNWSATSHSLTLTAANNISITAAMTWAGSALTLNAGGSITTSGSFTQTGSGSLTEIAGGNIAISGAVSFGNANVQVTSTSGTISNTSTAAWTWTGALALKAGGTTGNVIATGKLKQTGSGSLSVIAAGDIAVGATELGVAAASIQSTSGKIAITGAVGWTGALTLDAAGNITMSSAGSLTQSGTGTLSVIAGGLITFQGAVNLNNVTSAELKSTSLDTNISAISFYRTMSWKSGVIKLTATKGSISTTTTLGSLSGEAGTLTLDAATGMTLSVGVGSGSLVAKTDNGNITLSGVSWSGTSGLSFTATTGSITVPSGTISSTGSGVLTLQAHTGITLGTVSLGSASLSATTDTGNITFNNALSWSGSTVQLIAAGGSINMAAMTGNGGSLTLNAATDITLNAAANLGDTNASLTAASGSITFNGTMTDTGGSLTLEAATDITINRIVSLGTTMASLTATSGNITINAGLTWSDQMLTLSAANKNIYANSDLTGTLTDAGAAAGVNVGLVANFGTGVNADGTAHGLHLGISALGEYNKVTVPGTATVVMNGDTYTIIDNKAEFDAIRSNLTGHYVLVADVSDVNDTDFLPFQTISGLSSTPFTGIFNGFGHSLTLSASNSLTTSSAFSLTGLTQANVILTLAGTLDISSFDWSSIGGVMTVQTTGDININTALNYSSGGHILKAGGNLNINKDITVSGGVLVLGAGSYIAGSYINVNAALTVKDTGSLALSYVSTTDATTGMPLGGLNLGSIDPTTGSFAHQIDLSSTTLASPLTINGNIYTLIRNEADLASMSATGNYALANDFTVTTAATTASGAYVNQFSGNLFGLGHIISGLRSSLIGTLGSSTNFTSTVTSLGLTDVNINSSADNIGAFAGTSYGTLYNVFASGTVTGHDNVGGLIGGGSFNILSSYSNVTVTGANNVGGLIGNGGEKFSRGTLIVNSYATGNVLGTGVVGGLIGYAPSLRLLSNSFYQPGATSLDTLGRAYNVEGGYDVGGVVGLGYAGEIMDVYAKGTIVATTGAAGGLFGIIGIFNTVTNAQAINVNVSGVNGVGGLAGISDGTVDKSSASGTVTGFERVGGLIGTNSGDLTDVAVYAYMDTYMKVVSNGGDYTGGLVGSNSGIIVNAQTWASVTSNGGNNVGGLAGNSSNTIVNAQSWGAVSAKGDNVGGLVGYYSGAALSGSTANGSVTSSGNNIGGLIGNLVVSGEVEILKSTANGSVTGASYVGGLIGNSSIVGDGVLIITTATANGNVTSSGNFTGGLIGSAGGSAEGTTVIVGSAANGNVVAPGNDAGALIGNIEVGAGSGIYASNGNGTVTSDGADVGGLVGRNAGVTVDAYSKAPNSVGKNPSGTTTPPPGGGTTPGDGNTGLNDNNETIGSPSRILDHVVSGTATTAVDVSTSTTTITTSDRAIIDWTRFSVAAGEKLVFSQPFTTSVVLNRVIGNERSVIAGGLEANGKVFIVNSAGVLFAAGSMVNVGSLVATTLAINDSDFLTSNYLFQAAGGTGAVINKGDIVIVAGGFLALASQNGVSNTGNLTVPDGKAILASTNSLTLNVSSSGRLSSDVIGSLSGATTVGGILSVSGSLGALEAAGTDVLINANTSTGLQVATLTVTASNDINVNTFVTDASVPAETAQATTFTATAGNDVNINVAQSWSNSATSWILSGTNININALMAWSAGMLTLNAGAAGGFINVNSVMAASDVASLVVTYTTASDQQTFAPLGGINMAFALDPTTNLGNGSFAGKIDFSNNSLAAPLTINGNVYTLIRGWADLLALSGQSGNYALANDLTATPTTQSNAYIATFYGTLNGLGHTVSNLNAALFDTLGVGGITTRTAMVSNLGLPNASITQGSGIQGTLANVNYGSLVNDFATGTLAAAAAGSGVGEDAVGGLVGVNDYVIQGSYANVNVSGTTNVGGLVGSNGKQYRNSIGWGRIISSYAMGNVFGTSDYVGGLVGKSTVSTVNAIVDSFYKPGATSLDGSVSYNVKGQNSVGGLVGYLGGVADTLSGALTRSYASGTIVGANNVGGLVGSLRGTVSYSQAVNVNVTGGRNVGGLVGTSGNISNSSASGTVTGSENVGGLVGSSDGTLVNVTAKYVSVTSTGDNAGGLAGTSSGNIINAVVEGSVTAAGDNAGGVVGELTGGSIFNAKVKANVKGKNNVGGMVGNVTAQGNTLIVGSAFDGNVYGASNVGGLVGNSSAGNTLNIVGSTTDGTVYGTGDNVGGLLGNGQGTTIIAGSTSNVSVTGLGINVGALVGNIQGGLGSAIYTSFATGTVNGGYGGSLIGNNNGATVDGWSSYNPPSAPNNPNNGDGNDPGTGDNNPGSGNNNPGTGDSNPGTGSDSPGTGNNPGAGNTPPTDSASSQPPTRDPAAQQAASVAGVIGAQAQTSAATPPTPELSAAGTDAVQAATSPALEDNLNGIDSNIKAEEQRQRERRQQAAVAAARQAASRGTGGNIGATIRSIDVDGQRFNLQSDTPKPETPAQVAP